DFIIQRFHRFAEPIDLATQTIKRKARQQLANQWNAINDQVRYFRLNSIHLISRQQRSLEHHTAHLGLVSTAHLRQRQQRIQHRIQTLGVATLMLLKDKRADMATTEKAVYLLDPRHVLQRGYSITRLHGKALKSTASVREGDVVETVLAQGI